MSHEDSDRARRALTAASYGAAAALHSQPTEIDRLRAAIRDQIGDASHPQLVLRLGTVIQDAVSLRRPLSSVLQVSDHRQHGKCIQLDRNYSPACCTQRISL